MIRLLPGAAHPTRCPACHTAGLAAQVRYVGVAVLAQTTCPACGTAYYQTLPTGQFNRFPVAISANKQHVSVAGRGRWLVEPVGNCLPDEVFFSPEKSLFSVNETTAVRPGQAVILLLCLDACFGHALLMLANAQRHHEQHPQHALIAVVPRALVWLVPAYVAETWVTDLPLSGFERNVPGLDVFVQQQLTRFSGVWLSTARIHFDPRTTRFSDLTRTPKFDLTRFDREPMQVTFVLREDRLWLRWGWERFLFRVCVGAGWQVATRPLWVRWQHRRYRQLAHRLRVAHPALHLAATGLTHTAPRPGALGPYLHDLRQTAPLSPHQERTWCRAYAQSQVVVGVHGSGMLLPTSLAAGFVNLLPPEKNGHYAEDILLAHSNPIHQTLLGRFLPTATSPRQVATLIGSMLTEFPVWLAEARQHS